MNKPGYFALALFCAVGCVGLAIVAAVACSVILWCYVAHAGINALWRMDRKRLEDQERQAKARRGGR